MGKLFWIFWVGPKCHHKCPSKREAEGDFMGIMGESNTERGEREIGVT